MDLSRAPRVSSAGYRLPERKNGGRPVTLGAPADRRRRAEVDAACVELSSDKSDAVKRDQVWRELVWSERRGVREWEKNWGFLRNYDPMGEQKPEEPQQSYVPLFSDRVPNTSNQTVGSRLSTPLGRELVRLDGLLLWSGSRHQIKQDPEMLPC